MTRPRTMIAAIGLTLVAGGCTTFGTNVKGDFACRAPGGTCQPMTAIDAAAVVSLGGEQPGQDASPTLARSSSRPVGAGTPVRVAERTLTILIPAHVDEAGVLHDAATVHAVVEPAGWAVSPARSNTDPAISRSSVPSSLREAIAGASAPAIEGLEALSRAPYPLAADVPGTEPAAARPSAAALAAARAGHRIGEPVAPPAAIPALPRGKVVLPRGDAAAAASRVRALVSPQLAKQSPAHQGGRDGDPGDPFGTATAKEQSR